MTQITLIRARTSTVPPSPLTKIQAAIAPVKASIARTPKVTSAFEPDQRYIIKKGRGDNNERAKGALYFYNNHTKAGRRKSVWVWASLVTMALFPKFPQRVINQKMFKEAAGIWKAYSESWVLLGLVASPSVKKDLTRKVFTATVPLGAFTRAGYPAGLARFAVATYGPNAASQDFWEETVKNRLEASMVPGEYDLSDASPAGTANLKDLANFRAANGRIIIKAMANDYIGAFMQLEFTQRESEFLCNTPWIEIRPLDFYGVIRAWVDGAYGGRAKSPVYSIPIGRIAKQSDAKNALPRLSEDGLSLDEHGSIVALPAKLNDISAFEDKAATAYSQADGSFSAVGEDVRLKTPPPAMPVYIDWVNLKYSYTTLEGKLVIKNLDRSQPVNITHIRNFLDKKVSDDIVLNFLSFSIQLGVFFGLPEAHSISSQQRLLFALSKEVEHHGEYRTVQDAPIVAIQEYAKKDSDGDRDQTNSGVLLAFCTMAKKLKRFIDDNPTNAYAKYSVPTVIELQGMLTVFSVYAHKFGEVKALDNTRRNPYETQAIDPNWNLEPIPFVLPERGLMPHQVGVENKLRGCPDNATIPVAAGGGKTIIIAYEILKMMKAGGSDMFLIMCPSHLVSQYVKEFVYAVGGQVNVIPITTYTIRRHGLGRLGQMVLNSPVNTVVVADYNAITYRQSTVAYGATPVRLFPVIEFLRQYPFKYVACDEAHYLKNGSSRNAAAGRIIIEIQKKRLASGTMVANTMIDLVRQISLMDPSVFGTPNDFVKEYALKAVGSKVTEWKKGAELAVQALLRKNVVVAGAKRKEWAAILPFPVEEFHIIDFSENQLKCYQDILAREEALLVEAAKTNKDLRKLLEGKGDDDDDDDDGPSSLDNLLRVFSTVIERFMAAPGLDQLGKLVLKGEDLVSPKVIKAVDICREHIENNIPGKILIFTNYEDSAIAVYEAFPPDMKDMVIYYTASNKDACVAEFDANPKKKIMCGIEASMNTGLNLQAASRLIRVETVWTPGSLEQGNSRIGRPNVKEAELRPNVYYDWLVTNYTIDVSKASCLMAKTISKAKFDEAGSPNFDRLEVPPLFKLNLTNVMAMNDARTTLSDYLGKYEKYKQTLQREFADYRAEHHDTLFEIGSDGVRRLKMASLEKSEAPDGSAVLLTLPYVPGMELFKGEKLGLTRYDAYMRLNTAELEAENEAAEKKSGSKDDGDDDDEDGEDDGDEGEGDNDEQSADDERKAKLAAESAVAVGLQVHTEFGEGEIIRINRRFVKVRQPSGGVFWVNKLAAFVLSKPVAAGKDLRTQLVKLNNMPLEETPSLPDPKIVKMRPLKVKKRRDEVEDVEDEEDEEKVIEDTAIEMVLDFTIVNDFLGIRLVNVDNESAVRVAQGMGFKHPPQYFAAKMVRPFKVLDLFRNWRALGFVIDEENSRACEAAYVHFYKNRKSAPDFFGVATDNQIRNFYKTEFKPNPDHKHINPYPLMQDDELYIALPKLGHPGSLPAMQKARVPGVKWFVYGGNEELVAFTPRKEKASLLIKSLLDQGVVIPNIKDLIKKFRSLRVARDKYKGNDFAE